MSIALTARPTTAWQTGPLAEMAEAAITAARQGEKVQIVFDLDDTLFLVRPRKRVIFRELAEVHAHDDHVSSALNRLSVSHIPYDVKEALATVGIHHDETVHHLKSAFFDRFFNGDYTRHDDPNQGAAAYVRYLHANGVRVVYLTGRPEEMLSRTADTLVAHGFPLDNHRTALVLKRNSESHLGDAEFKGIKALEIAEWGRILGVLDNEPANLNAMYPAAPEAYYFLLDTDCSPNPPALVMGAHVVTHFHAEAEKLNASLAATPNFGKGGWALTVEVQDA